MPSGLLPGLRRVDGAASPAPSSTTLGTRAAGRRSSSGRSCQLSPSSGSGSRARRRPSAQESSTSSSLGLAGDDHPGGAGLAQGGRPGRRPTRRTPRRCRPGRRPAGRRSAASTSSTSSVGPATSTAMPPAASRLVANVARAVCAATVPIVARKTGVGGAARRAAPRTPRRSGGRRASRRVRARARAASRRGSGTRVSPVSGRRAAWRPGRRARRRRVDPRCSDAVERGIDAAGRLDAGRTPPRRRRRGRR